MGTPGNLYIWEAIHGIRTYQGKMSDLHAYGYWLVLLNISGLSEKQGEVPTSSLLFLQIVIADRIDLR